jgi:hypothetical protein
VMVARLIISLMLKVKVMQFTSTPSGSNPGRSTFTDAEAVFSFLSFQKFGFAVALSIVYCSLLER